jgi:hypothetical protein
MSEGIKKEVDELYISRTTKVVQARPVKQQEYKTLFPSETEFVKNDTAVRGYLVKDFDPHKTITEFEFVEPDKFEELYKRNEGLTFGDALELLRSGYRVRRQSWPHNWQIKVCADFRFSQTPFFQLKSGDITKPWLMDGVDIMACDWIRVDEGSRR